MIHARSLSSIYFALILLSLTILSGDEKSSKEIQRDIDSRKSDLQSLRNEIKDIEERLHLKNKEAISSTEILLDLENFLFYVYLFLKYTAFIFESREYQFLEL